MRSSSKAERVLLPSFEEMMHQIAGARIPAEGSNPLPQDTDGPEIAAQGEGPEGALPVEADADAQAEDELAAVRAACEQMQRAAEEEAQRILEQAREEAVALIQAAREEEAAKARRALEQERRQLREALLGAAEALQRAREELYAALEPNFLDTALHMAESILQYELSRSDEAFLAIVRNVLDQTYESGQVALHLPPGRFATLTENEEGPFMAEMLKRGVEIRRAPTLSEGDCMVTTDKGSIRGGVSVQLARIRFAVQNQQSEVQ